MNSPLTQAYRKRSIQCDVVVVGGGGAGLLKATDDSVGDSSISARGKRPQLTRGPFYALGSVGNYVNFTDGGLAVNQFLQVLGARDTPIVGCYAAGATGQGGLLPKGPGHHLIWAFASGRLAGKYAAQL